MTAFTKCIVLASLALSATALTTPHHYRNVNHHRAVAAHIVAPAQVDVPVVAEQAPRTSRKKRSLGKRCRARPSSSSAAVSASASASAPINVAPGPILPSSASSSSSSATSTSSEEPAPTSTSENPAPTSTQAPTTSNPPPATTPPSTPTTSAAAPSSSTGSGSQPSFMVGIQTGDGTFYQTGLGACGITNSNTDYIAAVSHLLFDVFPGFTDTANPNTNPVCNKQVTANYQGKSVTVTITDRCTGCAITDLDFSPSAFDELADESVGRIYGMTWTWDS